MGAPQIILIVLASINLLYVAHIHGEPRENWNFWELVGEDITIIGLLIWGGFFS